MNSSIILFGIVAFLAATTQINALEEKPWQIIKGYDEDRILKFSQSDSNLQLPKNILSKIENLFDNVSDSSREEVKLLRAKPQESTFKVKGDKATYNSYKIHKFSTIALKATQKLQGFAESYTDENYGLKLINNLRIPEDYCPNFGAICCDPYYAYRSTNGQCNNLQNAWWGMSETPFKRLVEPFYLDRINIPRYKSALANKFLPSARLVATTLHQARPTQSEYSQLFTYFAQALSRDLGLVASILNPDGTYKTCDCTTKDEDCFNIDIPQSDAFIRDRSCIAMPRSAASIKSFDCYLGAREQLNLFTHFADLHNVYGNNEEDAKSLRAESGDLLTSISPGSKYGNLPLVDPVSNCNSSLVASRCFKSGDKNINDGSVLAAMTTIWLRNHNNLAAMLRDLNPEWNDEKTYQEARKINIAQYQHVIYKEFLPMLIGKFISKSYGLLPLKEGYSYGYKPDLYSSISNEFITAAFRLHHLVNSYSSKADENLVAYDIGDISKGLFNLGDYAKDSNGIIRGLLLNTAYYSTPQINTILNNRLYEGYGILSSLGAINNQRGRDHGLAPYFKYRELCGLGTVKSWDDLTNIPKFIVDKLKTLYATVYDIDLYAGGVSELPVKDGLLGPTFSCIIAKQFYDLKMGDRFFYENGDSRYTRFTLDQLNEIKKTTMSSILCHNVEMNFIQRNAFLKANPKYNPFVNCANVPNINLKAWKNDPTLLAEIQSYFETVKF